MAIGGKRGQEKQMHHKEKLDYKHFDTQDSVMNLELVTLKILKWVPIIMRSSKSVHRNQYLISCQKNLILNLFDYNTKIVKNSWKFELMSKEVDWWLKRIQGTLRRDISVLNGRVRKKV